MFSQVCLNILVVRKPHNRKLMGAAPTMLATLALGNLAQTLRYSSGVRCALGCGPTSGPLDGGSEYTPLVGYYSIHLRYIT